MRDLWKDPVFDVGQVVICRIAGGYAFTEGKEYTVTIYEPRFHDTECAAGFTWPAYIHLLDDNGKETCCHAFRFIAKEATND